VQITRVPAPDRSTVYYFFNEECAVIHPRPQTGSLVLLHRWTSELAIYRSPRMVIRKLKAVCCYKFGPKGVDFFLFSPP
jgi:hypothetical protein